MESPHYQPMPPRKSNNKLIWGIVIAVVSVCCIGIGLFGYFIYGAVGKVTPVFVCGYKFQDIRSALLHYANGHNGSFPNAKTWQDDIQPDLTAVLAAIPAGQRPFGTIAAGGDFSCKVGESTTGIAFNSDLSGKKLAEVTDKDKTILLFEIQSAMKNSSSSYKPVLAAAPLVMGAPRGWFTAKTEGNIVVDFANTKEIVFYEDGTPPKVVPAGTSR